MLTVWCLEHLNSNSSNQNICNSLLHVCIIWASRLLEDVLWSQMEQVSFSSFLAKYSGFLPLYSFVHLTDIFHLSLPEHGVFLKVTQKHRLWHWFPTCCRKVRKGHVWKQYNILPVFSKLCYKWDDKQNVCFSVVGVFVCLCLFGCCCCLMKKKICYKEDNSG